MNEQKLFQDAREIRRGGLGVIDHDQQSIPRVYDQVTVGEARGGGQRRMGNIEAL